MNAVATKAQRRAFFDLYKRNPDGFATYRAFRKALIRPMFPGFGAFEAWPWCGMFVGVETDGYTHT